MPHARHLLSLGAAAALLPVLILAQSPAAAEPARSLLSVGARVVPACEVTTDGAGAASVSCATGSDRNVSIERTGAAPQPDRPAIARAAEGGDSASTLTWVTITY